ncbi:MAG: hypothetical protein IJV93_05810 [Lentisphaeria bacterium]|nr:hypothetical protein [Lentisphaeria bacterium]
MEPVKALMKGAVSKLHEIAKELWASGKGSITGCYAGRLDNFRNYLKYKKGIVYYENH